MIILTDSKNFVKKYFSKNPAWESVSRAGIDSRIKKLAGHLISADEIHVAESKPGFPWPYLFLVEFAPDSQYDALIRAAREDIDLPHGIVCAAGSGGKFHGFHGRPWAAVPGNLHLSAYFAPRREIPHFGPGFMALAAVSVLNTLDSFPALKGRAMIKWVNDILLEGGKVCGVLAHTQAAGRTVTCAVIGIGLNIETEPPVDPTPYVPRAAALRGFIGDRDLCNERAVFQRLLKTLDINYKILLGGGYPRLLDEYRRRSLVVGKEAAVRTDEGGGRSREIIRGRVAGIGENLELYFEGHPSPVTKGRLVLQS